MPTTYEAGRELCEKLHGQHSGAAMVAALQNICPDGVSLCRDYGAAGPAAIGLGICKQAITETILQTLPIAGFPAVANAFPGAPGCFPAAPKE